MSARLRPAFRRRAGGRFAALALPALAALLGGPSAYADRHGSAPGGKGAPDGFYAGVFAGAGRADNRIVDVDGFSNSGNPGSVVDYDDAGFAGGVLFGKELTGGSAPLRIEVDGAFGNLSAVTNRLDPPRPAPDGVTIYGGDETAVSKVGRLASVRLGVGRAFGRTTVFAAAGLAAARIESSVTDLDRRLRPDGSCCTPWEMDPDDSFRDTSTRIGWVIGAGVEADLNAVWTIRIDGSWHDFGRSTHYSNRSGNDACCGPGTPRRPVAYEIENRIGMVRLVLVRRFGGA